MSVPGTILVVAATARELASPAGWTSIACGVGPVEAGLTATLAILEHRPRAIIQVGIAGARRTAALAPGTIVIGTHAIYADLGDIPDTWATRTIEAPAALLHVLKATLPEARLLPIGTSARVGGTPAGGEAAGNAADDAAGHPSCSVEAMEGFAVLRAAQRAGIPAIEVRAISNEIEEPDRTRWHFDTAFAAITAITPAMVHAVQRALATPTDTTATPEHA